MKTLFTILFCSFLFIALHAEDNKYEAAMKKNLTRLDSAKGVADFLDGANSFERIAKAEKDKWLPYYYTSFFYTVASLTENATEKKDAYLDKADIFIHIADSLKPDNSEIYTVLAMISQARMAVDPMNRWMKYGALTTEYINKATAIDSLNPRPDYLTGVGLFYTPEQFGGGPKVAKPILEKSLAKFEKFVPENELMPNWGKDIIVGLLAQIKE